MDDPAPTASDSKTRRVAVIGIGRGGARVADTLASHFSFDQMDVVAADTDAAELAALDIPNRLQLGPEWTYDEGTGGDVTLGERAAGASVDELKTIMKEKSLLLVIAGLGGGTGGGATKVVARVAQDLGVPALFVAALPFSFEGNWRRREAEKALALLRDYTPGVIAIPNDMLFAKLSPNTPATRAFSLADRLLAEAVSGLARASCANGLITVDIAGIKSLLKGGTASSTLGIGKGTGEKASETAIQDFVDCPFIGGPKKLAEADGALITLVGGSDLSMGTIRQCLDGLQDRFSETARLLVGAYTDERMQGQILLTGLLCSYGEHSPEQDDMDHPAPTDKPAPGEIDPPAPKPKSKKRGRKQEATDEKQGLLPLMEQSSGIFSGTQPTTVNGENLDVPTFQRRGLRFDIGD